MARKSYTEEDRGRVRQALLDTGLEMAVNKGLGGLHLAELTRAVGISKPYFYTFFNSLEDFSLQLMEEQRGRLLRLLEQELARPEGTWEEHVESFFWTILRHRDHGILVMTQGEEAELAQPPDAGAIPGFPPRAAGVLAPADGAAGDPGGGLPAGGAGEPGVLLPPDLQLRAGVHALSVSLDYLEETAALHVKFLVKYLASAAQCKQKTADGRSFFAAMIFTRLRIFGFFCYDVSYID